MTEPGGDAPLDPRAELAELTAAVRALVEQHEGLGVTGIRVEGDPTAVLESITPGAPRPAGAGGRAAAAASGRPSFAAPAGAAAGARSVPATPATPSFGAPPAASTGARSMPATPGMPATPSFAAPAWATPGAVVEQRPFASAPPLGASGGAPSIAAPATVRAPEAPAAATAQVARVAEAPQVAESPQAPAIAHAPPQSAIAEPPRWSEASSSAPDDAYEEPPPSVPPDEPGPFVAPSPARYAPTPAAPAAAAPAAPSLAWTDAPAIVRAPLDERRARLALLAEEARDCRRCDLHQGRRQTVFSRGNPYAELCFVGEGPGADEDLQGYPFVGASGQQLDKMIAAMGYERDEIYICNIVKCRPPNNRNPTPEEMTACTPFVLGQLALIQPKVIVALGAVAMHGLFGATDVGITRMRGKWKRLRGAIDVMPTFHPAYLLRNPAAKRDVWSDLQEVMRRLGKNPRG